MYVAKAINAKTILSKVGPTVDIFVKNAITTKC
jgi:hypothetical protein